MKLKKKSTLLHIYRDMMREGFGTFSTKVPSFEIIKMNFRDNPDYGCIFVRSDKVRIEMYPGIDGKKCYLLGESRATTEYTGIRFRFEKKR